MASNKPRGFPGLLLLLFGAVVILIVISRWMAKG